MSKLTTQLESQVQTHSSDAWLTVCSTEDIAPNTGVCALLNGEQVAIFKVKNALDSSANDAYYAYYAYYAVSNFDPVGKANVLSRGLIGDSQQTWTIASPLYKEEYCLKTGESLADDTVRLQTYEVRAQDGLIQLKA